MPEIATIYKAAPPWFNEALEDAERLLKYAAEHGIDVDAGLRDDVLQARATTEQSWDETTAAHVLTALTRLSADLKPVTAESLKACCNSGTWPTIRNYWLVAILLAAVITPFSLASFVGSALSITIKADIVTGNELAVKLRAELGAPGEPGKPVNPNDPGVIADLQQYAAVIRSIDTRARELNGLVFFIEKDPLAPKRGDPKAIHDALQLPAALTNFADAANQRTLVYQDVRYFAQSVLDDVSFVYGALATCILPVMYALLGTCAYLLRTFERQITTRTFTLTIANSARFLIAAIGGAVVGLFNNFKLGDNASIPPLAIAFLVGYAVDVFFAFLEGMIQPFTKGNAPRMKS
jgi:hypothetical protein